MKLYKLYDFLVTLKYFTLMYFGAKTFIIVLN